MDKVKKQLITELTEKDRKTLDKYIKYYSNFIESNTAKTNAIYEDKDFKKNG
ncbi:hypothetical protein [Acetivibrio clariflavus]|uniref:hypothetical protein n=1 Tax=Acetivibrio clariflavus TaxID=288965 RepID=UPI0002E226B2|nr:hypothetical protein [Acetivibrio clariflavus]HOP99585.1 hypothetical protein [Acetivibrio clariflavus]